MSYQSCVFCERIRKNKLTTVTAGRFVSFRDGYPLTPGHTLVIPVLHLPSISTLSPDSLMELWSEVQRVMFKLKASYGDITGFNIGINDGKSAGQTVSHLHVHIIPRRDGDAADPKGGVRWIFPDRAAYWESGTTPHAEDCELMVANRGGRKCTCGIGGF